MSKASAKAYISAMRAAFLRTHGGPEVLEVGTVPTPEPGPGEVRVRVETAALNHLDVWVRKGMPGLTLQYPHILCGDGVGVVESVGPSVSRVKVGDAVLIHPGLSCGKCSHCLSGIESLCRDYKILGEHVWGTAAEFVVVPEANLFARPGHLTSPEAAGIGLVFTTAWQMCITRAQISELDTVLIHAAGSGVSVAAIQIARARGATVIAAAGSPAKLEAAKKLGAQHTVLSAQPSWADAVRKIVGKGGVSVILDHTGSANFEADIKLLARGGRYVTCGATSGYEVTLDLRHVFYRQLQILGSTMGSKRDFPLILELITSAKMKPVVDSVFALSDVQKAHARLEARAVVGKVCLTI